MDFWDRIFFWGAAHAVKQTVEEEQERQQRREQARRRRAEAASEPTVGAEDKVKAMILLAEQMIGAADRACGTRVEFKAEDIVPVLISAFLFQAVDGCGADAVSKAAAYDFAVGYCKLEGVSGGALLFPSEGNALAQAMETIGLEVLRTVMMAAVNGGATQGVLDFMTVFAGLALEIDEAIKTTVLKVSIPGGFASFVLEQGRAVIDELAG